jgi:hypothetical protein
MPLEVGMTDAIKASYFMQAGGDIKQKNENAFKFVGFGVFTPVAMKNAIFWDVTPCGSCKNRRFGGT